MVKGHERSGISINQWYPKDIPRISQVLSPSFTYSTCFHAEPNAWTQRKNRSTKTHLDVDRKLPAMGWENVFPAFSLGKWRGRRCSIRRCWFIEPKLKILFQHLAIVRLPAFKMCVPFDPSKTRRRLKCFISPRPMWALTILSAASILARVTTWSQKRTLGTYSLYSIIYSNRSLKSMSQKVNSSEIVQKIGDIQSEAWTRAEQQTWHATNANSSKQGTFPWR